MAGVIDDNGQQWEHCNGCGTFTKLQNLGYQPQTQAYPYGRDLCIKCVNGLSQAQMRRVRPAAGWLKQLTKVAA